jgi:predicted ATPase/DNA-binding CsgD family transcriptional regulator
VLGEDRRTLPVSQAPVWLTRLVGRERELIELRSLLWESRLLSLCGPGGVGKTRLAAALAESVRADLVGDAWWADLSATRDPLAVGPRVAAAVLRDQPASDPIQALAVHLREPALLVLDNCEQVLGACAELALALLPRAPSLRLLTTSRQPLGITGEQVRRVPGLALAAGSAGAEQGSPALQLLAERARQAGGAVDLGDPLSLEAARRICESLDGIPLAIELAAARVPALGLSEVANRLMLGHTELLEQRSPAGPANHRTLAATLRWSHELLGDAGRVLLHRLACFPGEFSLSAAEAVCADEQLPGSQVAGLLAGLVDRSLVQSLPGTGEARFRLLTVVRQFAARPPRGQSRGAGAPEGAVEQAGDPPREVSDGELASTVARHAHHYAGLAEVIDGEAVNRDAENFDAALDWLCSHDSAAAARLAAALWPLWYRRGRYTIARRRFSQLLEHAGQLPPAMRLTLTLNAGEVAFLQCDYEHAAELIGRAEQLAIALADRLALARVRHRLGSIAREQGRYEQATRLHTQGLELAQDLGDQHARLLALSYLGFVAWLSGQPAFGAPLCREAADGLRRLGHLSDAALSLVNLAACELYAGDAPRGRELAGEALEISRRLQFSEGVAWSLNVLAVAGGLSGMPAAEIAGALRESLLVHQRLGDRWRMASVLEAAAAGPLARPDPRTALLLLAAAAALRERIGTPIPPVEVPGCDAAQRRLQRRLSAHEYRRAIAEGRACSEEDATEQALAALESAERAGGEHPGSGRADAPALTPRERAVLALLADGHTNREIAAALYISPSTAGVHVSNLLGKLGAKRRVDAAAIAQRLGVLDAARAKSHP